MIHVDERINEREQDLKFFLSFMKKKGVLISVFRSPVYAAIGNVVYRYFPYGASHDLRSKIILCNVVIS